MKDKKFKVIVKDDDKKYLLKTCFELQKGNQFEKMMQNLF
jgi:hypothetical protein